MQSWEYHARGSKRYKGSAAIGDWKILSATEQPKLLRALSPMDRRFVKFLLATGLRISEALSIRPENCIKMEDHYLITVIGKGGKKRTIMYGQEPMDFTLLGNRITITNRIRRASKRSIGRTLSAHCMRHTFATRAIKDGKSLAAVSRYLGHSSVAITGDIYVHDSLTWEDVKP